MKRTLTLSALAIALCCLLIAVTQLRSTVRSPGFSRNPVVETDPTSNLLAAPQDFYQGGGQRRWRRQRDPNDRGGVPLWKNDEADPGDVFTFVRIQWSQSGDSGWRRRGGYRWDTDYPDADLNFSYRLQQLTSIKTDPNGKILKLTDK